MTILPAGGWSELHKLQSSGRPGTVSSASGAGLPAPLCSVSILPSQFPSAPTLAEQREARAKASLGSSRCGDEEQPSWGINRSSVFGGKLRMAEL